MTFLLLLLHVGGLHAQPVYRLGPSDMAFGAGGLGLAVGGYFVTEAVAPLDSAAIAALDPAQVPAIDRWSLTGWRPGAARASDIFAAATVATPALLLLDPKARAEIVPILVMGAEAGLIAYGSNSLVKGLTRRARPFLYDPSAPDDLIQKSDARMSFFSAHTMFSATLTFFTARIYTDLHPTSRWKPWVWAGAAAVPAAMAFLRVRANKHFPTDVALGYAVGAAIGGLIPVLHRVRPSNQVSLTPLPLRGGAGLTFDYRF